MNDNREREGGVRNARQIQLAAINYLLAKEDQAIDDLTVEDLVTAGYLQTKFASSISDQWDVFFTQGSDGVDVTMDQNDSVEGSWKRSIFVGGDGAIRMCYSFSN